MDTPIIRAVKILIAIGFLVVGGASSSYAEKVLRMIEPRPQQTLVWCWAATSQMVLEYYGVPNVNPAGDYQCGVVGAQGGMCGIWCGNCITSVGPTTNIVRVLKNYVLYAQNQGGFIRPSNFNPRHLGRLSPTDIFAQINRESPIIAGVSPTQLPDMYPAGYGFSQHVVVIVGYDRVSDDPLLYVNDPYPFPPEFNLYVASGGQKIQDYQYTIRYSDFVRKLHYANSIIFN
jgi:hypothetical protein